MKNLHFIQFFLSLVLVTICVGFSIKNKQDQLDVEVQVILKNNNLMGLTLSVSDQSQQVIYNKGFGFAKYEQQQKASQQSYYRVASISKTATAIGLMTLLDQKKFTLDDDISDILGYKVRNPNFQDQAITVRHLLSHTSSIRDGNNYVAFSRFSKSQKDASQIPDIKQLLAQEGEWYDSTTYGKEPLGYFSYCNLNFGIIGTIIEKLSGQVFDQYLKQNVFNKLNISGSFNVADIQKWEDIATLYEGEGDKWIPTFDNFTSKPENRNMTGYNPGTNGLIFSPQAGMTIKAEELLSLAQLLANNGNFRGIQIISQDSAKYMQQIQ